MLAPCSSRAQAVNASSVTGDGTGSISGFLDVSAQTLTASGDIVTTNGSISAPAGNISTSSGNITTSTGDFSTATGNFVTSIGNVQTAFGNITAVTGTVSGVALSDTAGTVVTGGVVTTNDVQSSTGTYSGLLSAGAGLSVSGGITADTVAVSGSTTTHGINNSGTVTTTALAVGSGGVSVASGAPVDFGGNRIQNVAAPIAATDAATKGYVDAALRDANSRIDQNTEGVAVAIALGGIVLPQGKTFALGANLGFYDDKQAIAAQGALRLGDALTLNGGVGVGFENNKVGGRVGFLAAW